jgi:hypothetical protein
LVLKGNAACLNPLLVEEDRYQSLFSSSRGREEEIRGEEMHLDRREGGRILMYPCLIPLSLLPCGNDRIPGKYLQILLPAKSSGAGAMDSGDRVD